MARSLLLLGTALVLMSSLASAGTAPALTLAAFAPNATMYATMLAAAKASLHSAAQKAALESVKTRPIKCPNGKPLVMCLWNVCKGKCAANQLCMPDYCGSCGAKCVNVTLPSLSIPTPKLPAVPAKAAAALGNLTSSLSSLKGRRLQAADPLALCPPNSAIDWSASLAAGTLKSNGTRFVCKTCPAGSVAAPGAVACTLCAPGTVRGAGDAKCKRCPAGSYAGAFGKAACQPCPANSFAPMSGSPACIKCPVGFKAAKQGSVKCTFTGI
ncbi:MAG: hypothetical protein J3K34DRAFT_415237 [Monoraphidium minutum]|nr:MAG: hypothetical protein J3K34DRAFT_415237 [Monoraphidium minutum]